ncbi:hypothetical protein ACIRSU_00075 [Streptomyces sp. NPDC101160]|uniref:hypothetical protein n=1 Tax=Streptomyces sp. NPDC101160 TaxID=3366118 RepID=UPI0038281813
MPVRRLGPEDEDPDVTIGLGGADWLTATQKAGVLVLSGVVLCAAKSLANNAVTVLREVLPGLLDALDTVIGV